MTEAKRYDMEYVDFHSEMFECASGEYVRHKDYALLQSRLESLEKDAERWRAATRDTEINDIAVYSFDKYGDDKIVMGDEADSVIDAAMQARKWGVSEELK